MVMPDPHKAPEQVLGSMCLMCKHYSPATEDPGRPTCKAFPTQIPEEIFYGEEPDMLPEPHLEPYPGQKGETVFEPAEGVTDEMVEEWDGWRAQLMIDSWETSMGGTVEDFLE